METSAFGAAGSSKKSTLGERGTRKGKRKERKFREKWVDTAFKY